ncbi:hypothetical protein Thiowin_00862 [Thiorhodovibrio winogradskyi]|uniref:Transposase n=1 Tax=Thiorhodovibrio winogradskyi TaxID=77007 RepID=A0ABZ0S4E6_9GAMM
MIRRGLDHKTGRSHESWLSEAIGYDHGHQEAITPRPQLTAKQT